MFSEQLRAARSLLGWTQAKLSEESGVSGNTVRRMESGSGPIRGLHENLLKIQKALERAGVEFTNSDRPGLRLKKRVDRLSD